MQILFYTPLLDSARLHDQQHDLKFALWTDDSKLNRPFASKQLILSILFIQLSLKIYYQK